MYVAVVHSGGSLLVLAYMVGAVWVLAPERHRDEVCDAQRGWLSWLVTADKPADKLIRVGCNEHHRVLGRSLVNGGYRSDNHIRVGS